MILPRVFRWWVLGSVTGQQTLDGFTFFLLSLQPPWYPPPPLPKVWEIEQNEWRIELWESEKLALELEAEVVLLDFQKVRKDVLRLNKENS